VFSHWGSSSADGPTRFDNRPTYATELDEIIGMFDLLDKRWLRQGRQFLDADPQRLPRFGPEEFNIGAVVDRHQNLDSLIGKLSDDKELLKKVLLLTHLSVIIQPFNQPYLRFRNPSLSAWPNRLGRAPSCFTAHEYDDLVRIPGDHGQPNRSCFRGHHLEILKVS
jgi:hypothetical protein